jgi:hypothetical protein
VSAGVVEGASERVIALRPRDGPSSRGRYLLGHADPALTTRVYQQVIDMGDGGVQILETVM